jgi:hypothetical protein
MHLKQKSLPDEKTRFEETSSTILRRIRQTALQMLAMPGWRGLKEGETA